MSRYITDDIDRAWRVARARAGARPRTADELDRMALRLAEGLRQTATPAARRPAGVAPPKEATPVKVSRSSRPEPTPRRQTA